MSFNDTNLMKIVFCPNFANFLTKVFHLFLLVQNFLLEFLSISVHHSVLIPQLLLDVVDLCKRRCLLLVAYLNKWAQVLRAERDVDGESLVSLNLLFLAKHLMRHQWREESGLLALSLGIVEYPEVNGFVDLHDEVADPLLLELLLLDAFGVESV